LFYKLYIYWFAKATLFITLSLSLILCFHRYYNHIDIKTWFPQLQGNFFQNIGTILVFAILGTAISAMVVGGGIYLLGQVRLVWVHVLCTLCTRKYLSGKMFVNKKVIHWCSCCYKTKLWTITLVLENRSCNVHVKKLHIIWIKHLLNL